MKAPGLHHTLDNGVTWKRAAAAGVDGEPRALAVHPDDAKTVAVATSQGLFLSRDAGERFVKAEGPGEGLSVLFDLEGKFVWYGAFDGTAKLMRLPLAGGHPVQTVLPALKDDAVAYIAQNPARRLEFAIATFERGVYVSRDAGQSWKQIADRGRGK
jgi:hypothetical protein